MIGLNLLVNIIGVSIATAIIIGGFMGYGGEYATGFLIIGALGGLAYAYYLSA